MESSHNQPAVTLYGYQKAWMTDQSRFKAGRFSRQSGKSFVASLEAVDDIAEAESKGARTTWILAGSALRQAQELAEKAKMHAEAYHMAASDIGETYFEDTKFKTFEIRFPGGSRIIALPTNPRTIRGFSGNVILDEFALCDDPDAVWAALFPSITRGGFKLRVISTPFGQSGKFYDLATNKAWSQHVITIHDAIAQGLPANAEELRDGLDDEEIWQREYLVEFVDEGAAFITWDMIRACEDQLAGRWDLYSGGGLYVGMDIGRRKDLTVIWIIEAVGSVAYTREVITLDRKKFSEQKEVLFSVLRRPRVVRACIDDTGIGMNLAEDAGTAFPGMVEGVTFTQAVKEALATPVRSDFEDRQFIIPVDRAIRNDIHSVKKVTTHGGNIRFDAERTKDGHADRFWAAALARDAWKGGEQLDTTTQPLQEMGALNAA